MEERLSTFRRNILLPGALVQLHNFENLRTGKSEKGDKNMIREPQATNDKLVRPTVELRPLLLITPQNWVAHEKLIVA
jgi:hypothetical protein